ncbi:MAG TPA: monovalent cation/H(+) antiporter subunit G [Candidatus Bathyarchaeia archaeon]|nr:monovalent cation/H(+) antiporter subunit G [Candidatus Bathyarchaeia archaeon]
MHSIDIISTVLLVGGAFFMLTGALGLLRLPDFYTRLHATGKCDTLGEVLIIVGCMVYQGWSFITIKLFFLMLFIFIANPVATHAIMKAAYVTGVKPWKKGDERM